MKKESFGVCPVDSLAADVSSRHGKVAVSCALLRAVMDADKQITSTLS